MLLQGKILYLRCKNTLLMTWWAIVSITGGFIMHIVCILMDFKVLQNEKEIVAIGFDSVVYFLCNILCIWV